MGIVARARAEITFDAAYATPPGGWYRAFAGPAGGPVDYAAPLAAERLMAWPAGQGFRGFGRGRFGRGRFGRGEGGFGFGGGRFGRGRFGAGSERLRILSPPLRDGAYRIGVAAYGPAGHRAETGHAEADVAIAGVPRPPTDLRIGTYAGGALGFSFAPSPDDEG